MTHREDYSLRITMKEHIEKTLTVIQVPKPAVGNHAAALTDRTEGKKELMSSVNGEVAWAAKQLRPDVAGSSGEVANMQANGTVAVLLDLDKTVRHLKETTDVGVTPSRDRPESGHRGGHPG